MPIGSRPGAARQSRRAGRWRVRVSLVIVLAALTASAGGFISTIVAPAGTGGSTAYAAAPPPADLFIQSIVRDDGTLGWEQLCPSAQMQLPQNVLVKQADTERRARARQGLTLTMDFIGARPRPGGGELRLYSVTGHWPNGTVDMRTYSVLTQASGCVEDVNAQ